MIQKQRLTKQRFCFRDLKINIWKKFPNNAKWHNNYMFFGFIGHLWANILYVKSKKSIVEFCIMEFTQKKNLILFIIRLTIFEKICYYIYVKRKG